MRFCPSRPASEQLWGRRRSSRNDGSTPLDWRTLGAVQNADAGEVGGDTRFHLEQDGRRIRARYSGGTVVDGYLVGTLDGRRRDVRYVQRNEAGETATGHSVGRVHRLDDGRLRVEDEWTWESRDGGGESVLVEVRE